MTVTGAGMPRRVALMIETNGPGGAENMLVHLATGLRRRGVEAVPVIPAAEAPSWLEQRFRDAGFEPTTFSIRRPLDFGALSTIRRILLDRAVDAVHSHEFTMAVYGRVASWGARVPHVITMHGGTAFAAAGRRRRALGWALRQSEARVAVSESTADFLAERCRVRRDSIDVIANGVEVPAGDRRRVRDELGLADDHALVLAVGNLYPVKGHRTLVEAAAALPAAAAPWTVAIAGRGEEEGPLRALIAGAGIEGRVRLLGLRTDVADLLAAADVFVMPSISEGLPLALLEAMSAGLPVVASSVGGIPSVVQNGVTGVLVRPASPAALADALRTLLANRELRRQLGARAAAEIPRRFGVDPMAAAYLEVYRHALDPSRL
jgi:glycosyltransferase involved in cell wall biosynthesis